MAIDLRRDQLLGLSEAAKQLPAIDGRRVHAATIWRWCSRGVRGIRLEHGRLGHRIVISLDALNRFVNRLAELDEEPPSRPCQPDDTRPRGRTETQRQREIAHAERRLKAAGVLPE